ncbi:MAG TPA: hypothetical protein PLS20_07425 [Ruminococcus flavefaciens]|nr:hypothetical protein [Ruminococcus flavefaciens]
MTDRQREIQKMLGRNNEIDRHVRTLERLYEVSVERANKSVDKSVKKFYNALLVELRAAQNDLKTSVDNTQKMINRVPDKVQRDILMLYHIACISMDEVAYVVHYDRSAVWVKYKQALDALATVLDNETVIK